jgi:hypothetical protein
MPHTNSELKLVSKYFVYHLRMYIETLEYIKAHEEKPGGWDTTRNSIIESNLIHARVLINFFYKKTSHKTDVIAKDYFNFPLTDFPIQTDTFLMEQSSLIGGKLVHLTKKAYPDLKSEQEWPIFEIQEPLVKVILFFLGQVTEDKFDHSAKTTSLHLLQRLHPKSVFCSINVST